MVFSFAYYFTHNILILQSQNPWYKLQRVQSKRFPKLTAKRGKKMIKVIIERDCAPGKEKQIGDLLIQLRTMAMQQPGYISGETLRELINPSHFKVISTWSTLKDWKTWQGSQQRLTIEEKMSPITNNVKSYICTVDHES
jgi:heme-degrading monooxygenase HmoA